MPRLVVKHILCFFALIPLLAISINAQANEICAESGNAPTFDSPFDHIPYLFGTIRVKNLRPDENFPSVTAILYTGSRTERQRVSRSGNYCFKLESNSSRIAIEVNGVEVTRQSVAIPQGKIQQDFEIENPNAALNPRAPGVISAKYNYPKNPKTINLYKQAAAADKSRNSKLFQETLKKIVAQDPKDFIAWAKLGLVYQEQEKYKEALDAYKKSLSQRIDYTPAWINVAKIRLSQGQLEAAIAVILQAIEFDKESYKLYQILGETYLKNKQGSLGARALKKSIELDPIGATDSHLQLAHLFELANANELAAKEYELYLSKNPNYADRKRLERFIKKYKEN